LDVGGGTTDAVENTGQDVVRSTADYKSEDKAMFSSTLFYVFVGAVAGVVIVVVVVAVVCYLLVCSRPRRDHVGHSRFTSIFNSL